MGSALPPQDVGRSFQDAVDVPGNLAGRVVGPGGAALRELEAQCGARVLVGRPTGLPLQFTGADAARAHRESARDTVRVHIFAPTRAALDAARGQLLEAIGENIKARRRPAQNPAADLLTSMAESAAGAGDCAACRGQAALVAMQQRHKGWTGVGVLRAGCGCAGRPASHGHRGQAL